MKNFLKLLSVWCLLATPAFAARTIVIPTCNNPAVTKSTVRGYRGVQQQPRHTPNCGWIVIRERRPRKVTTYHLPPPQPFYPGYSPASRPSSGVTYGGGWAEQKYVEPLIIENPFFKDEQ